jgi:hypothetical protein
MAEQHDDTTPREPVAPEDQPLDTVKGDGADQFTLGAAAVGTARLAEE